MAHLGHGLQARQLLGVEARKHLRLQLLLLLPLHSTRVHATSAHVLLWLLHGGRLGGRVPTRGCCPLRG